MEKELSGKENEFLLSNELRKYYSTKEGESAIADYFGKDYKDITPIKYNDGYLYILNAFGGNLIFIKKNENNGYYETKSLYGRLPINSSIVSLIIFCHETYWINNLKETINSLFSFDQAKVLIDERINKLKEIINLVPFNVFSFVVELYGNILSQYFSGKKEIFEYLFSALTGKVKITSSEFDYFDKLLFILNYSSVSLQVVKDVISKSKELFLSSDKKEKQIQEAIKRLKRHSWYYSIEKYEYLEAFNIITDFSNEDFWRIQKALIASKMNLGSTFYECFASKNLVLDSEFVTNSYIYSLYIGVSKAFLQKEFTSLNDKIEIGKALISVPSCVEYQLYAISLMFDELDDDMCKKIYDKAVIRLMALKPKMVALFNNSAKIKFSDFNDFTEIQYIYFEKFLAQKLDKHMNFRLLLKFFKKAFKSKNDEIRNTLCPIFMQCLYATDRIQLELAKRDDATFSDPEIKELIEYVSLYNKIINYQEIGSDFVEI